MDGRRPLKLFSMKKDKFFVVCVFSGRGFLLFFAAIWHVTSLSISLSFSTLSLFTLSLSPSLSC